MNNRHTNLFYRVKTCLRFVVSRGMAWYFLLFLALLAFNYAHFTYRRPVPRVPYLTGFDDLGYFVYARSLFFDGDLDFRNDYLFIVRLLGEDLAGPAFAELLRLSENGLPRNHFNAGTGIAALPGLLVFHLLAYFLHTIRVLPEMPSPFGPWYVFAFLTTNLAYGIFGLWLTTRVVGRFFPTAVAHLGSISTLVAGPALFYFLYQPGMSHLTSLACVAGALRLTLLWEEENRPHRQTTWALLWGLVVGFALSVRSTNLPLVFLACVPLCRGREAQHSTTPRHPILNLRELAFPLLGLFLGFLPQLISWRVLYGSWFANTYSYEAHLVPSHFFQVLFGRRHGLFFWHPWMFVSVLGLVLFIRNHRRMGLVNFAILLAIAWVYGNWQVYWLGVSFGMRGYVEYLPLFALGAASFLDWLRKRVRSTFAPFGLTLIFFILNLHLLVAFRGGVITVDGPLYWLDTLADGQKYKAQLRREWLALTSWHYGFAAGERASLWENAF